MAATRTQVCFTTEQRERLDALARRDGKTLAALVREAVDAYVAREAPDWETALAEAFGSTPGFESDGRGDWDRGYG
jgi:predicted DNA-binding protein